MMRRMVKGKEIVDGTECQRDDPWLDNNAGSGQLTLNMIGPCRVVPLCDTVPVVQLDHPSPFPSPARITCINVSKSS